MPLPFNSFEIKNILYAVNVPASGLDVHSYTVPAGKRWYIIFAYAFLNTTAAASYVHFRYFDGANGYPLSKVIGANEIYTNVSGILVLAGQSLQSHLNNAQAAINLGTVVITYQELPI